MNPLVTMSKTLNEAIMTENLVYLRIKGFEGPLNDITKVLNLEPTGGGMAGESMPGKKTRIIRKISSWDLKSSLSGETEVTEHIESLLDIVESRKLELLELAGKYEAELLIVKYVSDEFNTIIHVRKDQMRRLSDLNLEIVVDFYVT